MGKEDESLLKCVEHVHVEDTPESDDFTIVFGLRENEIVKNK